jgi:hypothetical protein
LSRKRHSPSSQLALFVGPRTLSPFPQLKRSFLSQTTFLGNPSTRIVENNDLISRILSHLPADSLRNLALPSLVSRRFFPLARKQLFASIERLDVKGSNRCLLDLLDCSKPTRSSLERPLFPALRELVLPTFVPIAGADFPLLDSITIEALPKILWYRDPLPDPPAFKRLNIPKLENEFKYKTRSRAPVASRLSAPTLRTVRRSAGSSRLRKKP